MNKKNHSNIVNDDFSSETISSRTLSDNDDVPLPDLDKYESSFINDDPIDLPPHFLQEIDQCPDSPVINNTNLPDECFFQALPSNLPVQSAIISSPSVSSQALVLYSKPVKSDLNSNNDNYTSSKKFRFCASSAFLTYPQCNLSMQYLLDFFVDKFRITSGLVSLEKHIDGSPHLHIWVQFPKKINSRNPRLFDVQHFHPNIGFDKSRGRKSKKKSKLDIFRYIIKDGLYLEYNLNVQKYLKEYKNHKAHIADSLISGEINLVNAVKQEPSLIFNLSSLQKNLNLFFSLSSVLKFKSRKSFWLYGSPGIGKSFSIRSHFPNVYLKSQNRWWDGYVNERFVLLDDFDCSELSHLLKIWSDSYLFNGEIKGGVITPSYEFFFVTSNYDLSYFYSEPMLKKAMLRRFTIINCDQYLDNNGYFNFDSVFSSFNFD